MRRDRDSRIGARRRGGRSGLGMVGILLKAPIPGQVKTRLGAAVGMEAAADLHRAFSGDLIAELSRLAARLWIFYTPDSEATRCRALVRGAAAGAIRPRLHPQGRGRLGARLRAAFDAMRRSAGSRGRGPKMVLVGTDAPLLERRAILRALDLLDAADLVLGPARDGGYYLIGLRSPRRELFDAIPWSTPRVLRATLERARRLGLVVRMLPPDRDVDCLEDLRSLWRRLRRRRRSGRRAPGRTYRACRELFRSGARRRRPSVAENGS